MRNRFMIYNIHAHFMMERKGIEIFKKITQCELLLLNYNLFLSFDISILKNNGLFVFNIFHLWQKWMGYNTHLSSVAKELSMIYICVFLNHDETFLIFWYTKCLLWNCSEFGLVNYVTE